MCAHFTFTLSIIYISFSFSIWLFYLQDKCNLIMGVIIACCLHVFNVGALFFLMNTSSSELLKITFVYIFAIRLPGPLQPPTTQKLPWYKRRTNSCAQR